MAHMPTLGATASLLAILLLLFHPTAVPVVIMAAAGTPLLSGRKKHDVPAVFAFGDSTLDTGNNNRLPTAMRADHAPYGRDFPGGAPTGRFSEGKLLVDFVVEAYGIKDALPAYRSAGLTDADAATGVCFASGGSGLDDATATNAGVATFASQLADFEELVGRMGAQKASEVLNRSVFLVSDGTNDMIMNYYLLPSSTYTLDQYHDLLVGKLRSYMQSLYSLGARRILVAGLPPVGCLPFQLTLAALRQPPRPEGCIAEQNAAAERYNAKLRRMVAELQSGSLGARAAYANIYTPLMDMANHPHKYGFVEISKGCCGTGLVEMGPLCTDLVPMCSTPSQFMFWDAVHPTQATYRAIADHFLQNGILQFDG